MTQVAAADARHAPSRAVDKRPDPGPDPRDPGSFVNTLLAMIDRELTGNQRSFGGGTMRPTVERFGAHGFFDAAPPTPVGGAATAFVDHDDLPADDAAPAPGPPPVATETPPSLAGGIAVIAPQQADQPMVANGADQSIPGHIAGLALPLSFSTNVDPNQAQAPAAPAPVAAARRGSAGEASRPPVAARPAPPRPAVTAASNRKVSLDVNETGVAVSVTGDPVGAKDERVLLRSVAQLLARHGLVLSELRVGRHPAQGRQEEN